MNMVEHQSCDSKIMFELSNLINSINTFAQSYKMLHDVELEELKKAQINSKLQNNFL